MAKAEKGASALRTAMDDVNKKYGKGTILFCDEAKNLDVDRIPFGVFELDAKIGGGVPRGRVTILSGGYSTGKTGLTYKAVAQAQRRCRFCNDTLEIITPDGEVITKKCRCKRNEPNRVVWADAEKSFEPRWAAQWGVDTSKVVVIQTEYAEQCVDVGEAVIRSGECDFFVVDSVAALATKVEVVESSEKKQMGGGAALMAKALRKWTAGMNSQSLLVENRCTIVLINQLRMNIGGYHAFLDEPGGEALGFFASLRLRLKKEKEHVIEASTGRKIGVDVEFDVKKNKTFPLSNPGNFRLYFVKRPGIEIGDTDTSTQILRAATYWSLIKKSGAWVYFPDGTKVQGLEAAGAFLDRSPEYRDSLAALVVAQEQAWLDGAPIGEENEAKGKGPLGEAEAEDVESTAGLPEDDLPEE